VTAGVVVGEVLRWLALIGLVLVWAGGTWEAASAARARPWRRDRLAGYALAVAWPLLAGALVVHAAIDKRHRARR
jgi:hypothetical protein